MATANIRHDPGPIYDMDNGNLTVIMPYVITDVDVQQPILSLFAALPVYGEAIADEWAPPDWSSGSLTVKSMRPRKPDDALSTTWNADVIYATPSGSIFPPSLQQVHWSIGTVTQRTDIDIGGGVIGLPVFVNEQGRPLGRTDGRGDPRYNPHAEMGGDVLIPAVEFEIMVPLGSVFNPGIVATLAGRANGVDFSFVDHLGRHHLIPRWYCLFMGGMANPETAMGDRISYRFIYASMDVTADVPLVWSHDITQIYGDGPNEPLPLPVVAGIFPVFKPMKPDEQGNLVYDAKEGDVPQLVHNRVFKAYRDDDGGKDVGNPLNFTTALGITS